MDPRPSHGHRHSAPGQHEHEHEPQYGLPEALPAGETMLWQGAPDWKTLAIRRFHVRKLVLYFALMLALRLGFLLSEGSAIGEALRLTLPMLVLSAAAVAMFAGIAWYSAATTVYTLTDKRVVMRIGIVLTITLNLPLSRIEAADLKLHSGSIGDIALRLNAAHQLAYLHLWPHARPWRFKRSEPMLLCLADAAAVAGRLTTAWRAAQAGASAANGRAAGVAAVRATADADPIGTPAPRLAPR